MSVTKVINLLLLSLSINVFAGGFHDKDCDIYAHDIYENVSKLCNFGYLEDISLLQHGTLRSDLESQLEKIVGCYAENREQRYRSLYFASMYVIGSSEFLIKGRESMSDMESPLWEISSANLRSNSERDCKELHKIGRQ